MLWNLHDRILGSLVGAAAGDAMGAATEARTPQQIMELYGHPVRDFEVPPMDTFARGNPAGRVTDDFSSAFFIAQSLAEHGGNVDRKALEQALVQWSQHRDGLFFDRFAGPTTRLAIHRMKEGEAEAAPGAQLAARQATNGAGMRIAPVGLLHPGDLDATIADSLAVTSITHNNHLAISGACAISCAVSRALLPDADVYAVLQAALYGAGKGEELGLAHALDAAGPSVVRRTEKAVEIGLSPDSLQKKIDDIIDLIGTGLHVSEAVPAAIGFVAACGGDATETIFSAVNAGYDTDTVATMCGAIVGALHGAAAFPDHYLPLLTEANGLAISDLAIDITAIAQKRMAGTGGNLNA